MQAGNGHVDRWNLIFYFYLWLLSTGSFSFFDLFLKLSLFIIKPRFRSLGKKKLPSKKFMVASLSLKLRPEITKHMIEMSMLAPAVVEGTTSEKAWQQGVEDCISKVRPWPHALQIVWKCLHIGTHEIFFFRCLSMDFSQQMDYYHKGRFYYRERSFFRIYGLFKGVYNSWTPLSKPA